jgi:zinc protease
MRLLKSAILSLAITGLILPCLGNGRETKSAVREDPEQAPNSRVGVLPNGFRYVIARQKLMPGIVRMSLDVAVGYNGEGDDQVEVAHLLEHVLAGFYSDSSGVRRATQDMVSSWGGFEYGESVNASTNDNFTRYLFRVPAGRWRETLALVREQAQGSEIAPNEVNAHRPLVIDERRLRGDDWGELPEMSRALSTSPKMRNILIADRERSMKSVPFASVQRFYARWYRPELETLYVVGDINPALVEADIKARFSSVKVVTGEIPPQKVGVQDFRFFALPSPHAEAVEVRTFLGTSEKSGAGAPRKMILHSVIAQLLTESAAKDSHSFAYPLTNLQIGVAGEGAYKTNAGIEIHYQTSPAEMHAAVARSFQIIGRILQEGIDPAYLDQIKKPLAEYRARRASFSEVDFLDSYRRGAESGRLGQTETIASADAQDILSITPDEILAELKTLVADDQISFTVYGPEEFVSVFGDEHAVRASSSKGLADGRIPGTGRARRPDFSMLPHLPSVGKPVVSNAGEGVKQVSLANGLSLFLLRDETQTSISATAINRKGLLGLDPQSVALAPGVAEIVELNGAGGLNKYELENYLEDVGGGGFNISLGLSRSQISIETAAGQEETLIALLASLLSRPRIEPMAIDEFKRMSSRPGDGDGDNLNDIVYSAFETGVIPASLNLPAQIPTTPEIETIWRQQFGQIDDLVVVLSGAISDEIIGAVAAKYLAPLSKASTETVPPLHLAQGTYRIKGGKADTADVKILFRVPFRGAGQAGNLARAMAPIWSDRVRARIRDVENGSYQPTGGTRFHDDAIIFEVNFTTRLGDVDRLVRASKEELENLQKSGLTESEFARMAAFRPLKPQRSPYWIAEQASFPPRVSKFEFKNFAPPTDVEITEFVSAIWPIGQYVFILSE